MKLGALIRRSLLLVAPILIAIIGALLFVTGSHQQIGDPYIRTIVSKTHEWRKRVNLTNAPIREGIAKSEIEKRLLKMGYVHSNLERDFYKVSDNEELWIKDVPGLPCRIDYVIVLNFEDGENLKTAEGMQQERGCL